ncbi:hypothetical protein GJ496_008367 [Pomphorhynchus laevis]|nr:hypothetical protein GJ496_008367 [Pomphorhynchus laevis]
MAKLEFEYDETGDKFCYFILGFYLIGILPFTYFLWPDWKKLKPNLSRTDQSSYNSDISSNNHPEDALIMYSPCKSKQYRLNSANKSYLRGIAILKSFLILLAWLILGWIVLKTNEIQQNQINASSGVGGSSNMPGGVFDPFQILEIDSGASTAEIKAAYKKLVLIHHPDRKGDENIFLQVTKAYKTLTDPQTKSNWEKYGNPDGPGLMRFGIALPKWIIEGRNAAMLIALYGLVFIIGLPVAVGTWWYRSIKYTSEKILVDTSHLYSMFLLKTPSMNMSRVIMVLSGSLEFEKSHNSNIVERASDNEDIPTLMHSLSVNLNERTKERPLCFVYSVKARTLIYAYLCREKLPSLAIEKDMHYIVSLCPMLLTEMTHTTLQLILLGKMGEIARYPTLETFEILIKCCALVVQALEERKNALCQLPHISEKMRRLPSVSLKQLAAMSSNDRSSTLKPLSTCEINDIMKVLSIMPLLSLSVKFDILEDNDDCCYNILDNSSVTTNSLVTATVTLRRRPLFIDEASSQSKQIDRCLYPLKDSPNSSDYRVFCPFFPGVKYEHWWIYLVDRKQRVLVASVAHSVSLKDSVISLDTNGYPVSQFDVRLKFVSPAKPGSYQYQLNAKSDSYIDLDASEVIKFDVVLPGGYNHQKKSNDHKLAFANNLSNLQPQNKANLDDSDRCSSDDDSHSTGDDDEDEDNADDSEDKNLKDTKADEYMTESD